MRSKEQRGSAKLDGSFLLKDFLVGGDAIVQSWVLESVRESQLLTRRSLVTLRNPTESTLRSGELL